jgi:hypothetical protein
MLPDLSARLTGAVERKKLKKKLEQDLSSIEKELHEKTTRLEALTTRLDKEKTDLEKLERTSLTSLFYSVLGSREQQLEKERQEMLVAQLQYQQTKFQVNFLKQEQDTLSLKLEGLKEADSEYMRLLSGKESLLRQSNGPVAHELVEVSEQLAAKNSEIKEIDEAIFAGNNVIFGLEQVIGSLESAEGWGTWDLLGGGLLATAAKHSRIDEARSRIHDVQAKMSRFKRELADVQRSVELKIDIGSLETFADFFFDGLIIDWVVQSKIVDSLERSKQAKDLMAQAVTELESCKKIATGKVSGLLEKRASLIERA